MTKVVSLALNDDLLGRMAGDESYRRGLDYFTHGHVESLDATETAVRASVRGNQDYTVELTVDEGVLDYACDCPVGVEARFCKHCVAVALAWRNSVAPAPKPKGRGRKKAPNLADSAAFLKKEPREALIEMILDWAKDDARLRERLVLYAARRAGPESSVAAAELAFQKAVRVRGFLRYREASSWARGVHRAIEPIEQLLKDGQAAAAIELSQTALLELCEAIESVDDSDGHFASLRERLELTHLEACREAPPPGPDLARRLLQWELNNDWEIFYDAVSNYSSILGASGMKVYQELAEREWEKVPVRTGKAKNSEWGKHFRITKIMESLAKLSGDVERVVAVLSRDLSNAYDYLKIAETYLAAGKPIEALQWAEKGLAAFPVNTDSRLREFVAGEYHRQGRHEEAMELVWAAFPERPDLTTYTTLERHATTAGVWPKWREQALSEVRARIARANQILSAQGRTLWKMAADDRSLLVEIFLHESRLEEAWREAEAGGCSDRLWLRLAEAREKDCPEDAAPVYLRLAGNLLQIIRNSRYEEPVELLIKAASAMKRANRGAEFVRYLDALRGQYKSKRNFTKLLEEQREALLGGS